MSPYIPTRDSLLVNWAENFSTLITDDPTAYGLQASDAVSIAAATSAFTTAYSTATNPVTRTAGAVANKNATKAALLGIDRPYAQQIKNNNGVSNEAKTNLGLNIDDPSRTPVPAPSTAPILAVIGATPLSHTLRYSDTNTPDKRSKPFGVKFLVMFRYIGTTVQADPTLCPFLNVFSKQPCESPFVSGDVGKIATYFSYWINTRGDRGPWSNGIHLNVV